MHWVKDASYVDGYKIRIRFENDEVKVIDLADHLDGGVFEPLKDISYFKSFEVNRDIDTVVWPNEADFSPDFLYTIGQVVNEPVNTAAG
ncbi:MAG: DUF2442 domain-containing protein [Deltaproteobacteria bacterium]|nr:DUF2442 domain-containing protein [Deltaproteobacteria bacterium]